MSLKIIFVSQSSNLYGSERGLLSLLRTPLPSNFFPILVCPSNGPLWDTAQALGIDCEHLEFGGYGWLKRPDWQLKFLLRFIQIILKHKPDVIVINFEGNVPLTVLAGKLTNCPVIRMLKREVRPAHSGEPGFSMYPTDRWSFLNSKGVICISGAVEQQLRSVLQLNDNFPVTTLFDPQPLVEIDAQNIEKRRQSLGLSSEDLVVGQFCRLHPVKGVDTLIRAIAIVLKQFPFAKFLVVGDADGSENSHLYAQSLRKLSNDLGVEHALIWTGFVNDPFTVMACCNFTVLPTRAEGLGRVVIESWSVDRAVIASDTDGPGEVIRLSGGGILHPVEDHEALARSIIDLCADSKKRAFLANLGKTWLINNCDPDYYRERCIKHIEKFINS